MNKTTQIMKKTIAILTLVALWCAPMSGQSVLERLKERAKNATENAVGNKIEEGINGLINGKGEQI
jgi:hypothetical protein